MRKKKISTFGMLYAAPMLGGGLFWILLLGWALVYGLMLGVGALIG